MTDPRETLIQAESALFAATEEIVSAMKEQGFTRQEAQQRLERLQEGQDRQACEVAMAQFDMIWPEGT